MDSLSAGTDASCSEATYPLGCPASPRTFPQPFLDDADQGSWHHPKLIGFAQEW